MNAVSTSPQLVKTTFYYLSKISQKCLKIHAQQRVDQNNLIRDMRLFTLAFAFFNLASIFMLESNQGKQPTWHLVMAWKLMSLMKAALTLCRKRAKEMSSKQQPRC